MWSWIPLMIVILPIPWLIQYIWPHRVQVYEVAIVTAVSAALTLVVYVAGSYIPAADVEMLNGQILRKVRDHGRYERPYNCNCTKICTGTGTSRSCYERCSTCYETHYTVNWYVDTTVRQITLHSLDSTSRSVYGAADPAAYVRAAVGDPVTVSHPYINYVKAAPDSLFHASAVSVGGFKDRLPAYPSQIYDTYKLDRVVTVGVAVPDQALWNRDISKYLGDVGPTKQVNLVIVFVNTNDSNYLHALEHAWIGGKKNDVVVIVGTTSYPRIDWVRVMAWTDVEEFKVRMTHDLESLETVDREIFMAVVTKHISNLYQRKPMKDFEYLADSMEPPLWVLLLSLIIGIGASLGISYYFYTEHRGLPITYRRHK
jgi:hypothetical protein